MRRVHFLNVKNGACSLIQHTNGNVSMFDVNCAKALTANAAVKMSAVYERKSWEPVPGNYHQKETPDNPLEYLVKHGIDSIFRFILTHPDMDHLGGIKALFSAIPVINFWDTANTKEFDEDELSGRLKADWEFYKILRDSDPDTSPRRLLMYSGDKRDYFKDQGLRILSPTKELVQAANKRKNWNDASYVVLYTTINPTKKILFTGDSEDDAWEHILENWKDAVSDVDVLIAPHHGRHSGRDYEFLKVVNPRLTLFGNALTEHHAHQYWNRRGLTILTNNQAGYVVLDFVDDGIKVFVKNEEYAQNLTEHNGWETEYSASCDGWYLGTI